MDCFSLLVQASLAASRTILQRLLACLNFTLESEDFTFSYIWKTNYGRSTSSWKSWRWVRHDLIFTMRDIYINSNFNPHTKFTSSNKSTEFKDILPLNISQIITKTIPISTRIVISYVIKWHIQLQVWQKINGNWDNNMLRIFQWKETHCTTNRSVRRNK